MSASFAHLDEIIETLRGLDRGNIAEAIAKRAAPLLESQIRRTAKAGQDPEGRPWPKRKDGGAPLQHAGDHVHARASGNVVRITLTGPDVFHHFGATHGGVRRQVIPDAGAEIPESVRKAILEAARAEVQARVSA